MQYARAAIVSPRPGLCCFAVPPGIDLSPGDAVQLSRGSDTALGVVIETQGYSAESAAWRLTGIVEPSPLLHPHHIRLARWLSSHYCSPLPLCLSPMLPPGLERYLTPYLQLNGEKGPLSKEEERIVLFLKERGRVAEEQVSGAIGVRRLHKALPSLLIRGVVRRTLEFRCAPTATPPRQVPWVELKVEPQTAKELAREKERKAPAQSRLLYRLSERPHLPLPQLKEEAGVSSAASLYSLQRSGIIAVKERGPSEAGYYAALALPTLGPEEISAYDEIVQSLSPERETKRFLLFGPQRERVYLHLIREVLARGGRVLFLTPFHSLRTVELLRKYFPDALAVFHSRLPAAKRCETWLEVREGHWSVVVGQRGAVFAPLSSLKLIIIDEEEEQAYKEERPPFYHARETALALGRLTRATVVLGSATPDVQSFFLAERRAIKLLKLPQRPRPDIEVIDLRQEVKEGHFGFLSRRLQKAAEEQASQGGRVVLFLNRKGAAPLVKCRRCGFVLYCRSCDVPLNYHSMEDMLLCHRCQYRTSLPPRCPRCNEPDLSLLGVGIERVCEEISSMIPPEQLAFYEGDGMPETELPGGARVSLGTRTVTRADFPEADLVGVVNADTLLNLPDFRAGEKTFQMLYRAICKAKETGKVIIQTYFPEHYAIKAAASLDYLSLYRTEVENRRRLNYPPFCPLARLVYCHPSREPCRHRAERMAEILKEEKLKRGLDVEIKGPAPAFIARVRGLFRWQILLRGKDIQKLLSSVPLAEPWTVDIEPYDFL